MSALQGAISDGIGTIKCAQPGCELSVEHANVAALVGAGGEDPAKNVEKCFKPVIYQLVLKVSFAGALIKIRQLAAHTTWYQYTGIHSVVCGTYGTATANRQQQHAKLMSVRT